MSIPLVLDWMSRSDASRAGSTSSIPCAAPPSSALGHGHGQLKIEQVTDWDIDWSIGRLSSELLDELIVNGLIGLAGFRFTHIYAVTLGCHSAAGHIPISFQLACGQNTEKNHCTHGSCAGTVVSCCLLYSSGLLRMHQFPPLLWSSPQSLPKKI